MRLIFGPAVADVVMPRQVKGTLMPEEQIEMELTHDDRYAGQAGSVQAPGKARVFASRLYSAISDCWTLTKPEVQFPDRSDDLHRFLFGSRTSNGAIFLFRSWPARSMGHFW